MERRHPERTSDLLTPEALPLLPPPILPLYTLSLPPPPPPTAMLMDLMPFLIATEIRAWVGARTVHGAMDVMVVHPRVVGALALVTAHEPPRANPFVRLFAGERGEGGGERERER